MNYDQALLSKNQTIQSKHVSILESAVTLGIGVFTSVPFMQGRLLAPGVMPDFNDLKTFIACFTVYSFFSWCSCSIGRSKIL